MQGNSLFALAGLANTLFRYRCTIQHDHDVTKPAPGGNVEHQPLTEWIATVVDTLLVVLDGNVKTFGIPMDWCQQVRMTCIYRKFYQVLKKGLTSFLYH